MKYFVTDLDNSARYPESPLPAATQQVLRDLEIAGGGWAFATGREAQRAGELPFTKLPCISEGGGRIVQATPDGLKTLWCQPIAGEDLRRLNDAFATRAIHFAGFMPVEHPVFYGYVADQRAAQFATDFYGSFLSQVTYSPVEFLDWLAAGTAKITLKILEGIDIVISALPQAVGYVKSEGFVDLTGPSINKATALREWARITGIDLKHIAYAGDSGNDLSVFEQLDIGAKILVGNNQNLAPFATHRTASPDTLAGTLRQVFNLPLPVVVQHSSSRRSALAY